MLRTQVVTLPCLYLDGTVFVHNTWLAYLTHVTVRDVLAINVHTVHMLPHTVKYDSQIVHSAATNS